MKAQAKEAKKAALKADKAEKKALKAKKLEKSMAKIKALKEKAEKFAFDGKDVKATMKEKFAQIKDMITGFIPA